MALKDTQARIYSKRPKPNTELIRLRINAGLTPNVLAKRAFISGNTVRAAEAGHYIEVPQQSAIIAVLSDIRGHVIEVTDIFPLERQRVAA